MRSQIAILFSALRHKGGSHCVNIGTIVSFECPPITGTSIEPRSLPTVSATNVFARNVSTSGISELTGFVIITIMAFGLCWAVIPTTREMIAALASSKTFRSFAFAVRATPAVITTISCI
uniref:Uncharacterized protein n=1 Tax=Glossina brevipalpis TaxID=37001 RepID=A0A1A9X0Z6_9MUSC